ncbi:hypothetical protein BVRB_033050, partial [Beta vulgaris subsp. vulgaris]
SSALLLLTSGLKIEDVSKGEDDGTMTSVAIVSPGVYRTVAPNHDSYLRFTMSSGCYNLNSYSYMKMKAWAPAGVQFTIDLRQGNIPISLRVLKVLNHHKGFDDCRLDLWPYVRDSASALVSHYTAKGVFDGSPDGQDVWIPMSHFNVDRSKIAQVVGLLR